MTASKGVWKYYVCESIDPVRRTTRQWANYLGVSKHILNDRAKRLGGMQLAIETLRAGTGPTVWSPKSPNGQCKRGHKIEGDNVLVVCDKGTNFKDVKRCRKCYRKGPALQIGEKRPGNQKPRDMCNLGLHKLEGDNIVMKATKGGRLKRRCRACLNQYQRRRMRNLKMGIIPKVRPGQTLEERIALFSDSQSNGCVLWTGTVTPQGMPYVNHPSFAPAGGRIVQMHLWEQKHGKVPHRHSVRARCGNKLCIAEDQFVVLSPRALMKPESAVQRWETRRARYRYAPLPRELEKQNGSDWTTRAHDSLAEAQSLRAEYRNVMKAFRSKLPEAELDDIWQRSLIRLFEAAQRDEPIESVRAFLFTVARRLAIDETRRAWNRVVISRTEDAEDGDAPHGWTVSITCEDPLMLLERIEQEETDRIALRNRFNQLPAAPRRAYLLRAEGLNNVEVAQRLGLSVHTIENQLQKCFDHLRRSPSGRDRRPLLVPLDVTRHYHGLRVRRNEKNVHAVWANASATGSD